MSRGRWAGNMGRGSHWIRDKRRRQIYWRDGFRCLWCGVACTHTSISLDHVLPRSCGGGNGNDNLITSCVSCNCDRGDAPAVLFAANAAVFWSVVDAMGRAVQ